MKHCPILPLYLTLILLTSLFLSSCGQVGGVAMTPSPTAIPPTDTPQPTATFTPQPTATLTSTPTLVPTATADLEATRSALKTEVVEKQVAQLAPYLEDYGIDPADGHLAYWNDRQVKLEVTSYLERKNYVLDEVGPVTDFVIQSKITWDTSGALSLCGITFHAEEDLEFGDHNQFMMMRLQYDPGWTIWRWNYGQFQYNLAGNWLPSRDIHDKNDSSNLVALVVRGKDISVYINGDKQRLMEDSKYKEGWLALSAYQESGQTVCEYEDTWVWLFDK